MRPVNWPAHRRGAWTVASFATLALVASFAPVGAVTGSTVATYGYGPARTGHDMVDAAVNGVSATPRWDAHLDGAVYGEPLVLNNQVIVATERDTIYGLSSSTGTIAWRVHVGTAVSTSVIDTAPGLNSGCGNINPLGITGTPVIDVGHRELFVAAEVMVGASKWQNIRHRLFAISLVSHHVLWSRGIDPTGGNAPGGYTIAAEQQRPALTEANGRVYVNFGGLAGDCGIYHGFVVGVPSNNFGGNVVYQVPSRTEGAVWAVNGAVVSSAGNLYVTTGNGSSSTTYDGSDSVVELSATLHRLAQWAPTNWLQLSADDADIGSAGVVPVPGTSLLFVAGKPDNGSVGYLVSSAALGHGPSAPIFTGAVCTDPTAGVFGADASDVVNVAGVPHTYIYAACGNGTEALLVNTGPTPSFSRAWAPSSGSPNGPPIVAGALVWALDWNGDSLVAMDPVTGAVRFARSTDQLAHFATPTLIPGRILVPTAHGVEAFSTTSQ